MAARDLERQDQTQHMADPSASDGDRVSAQIRPVTPVTTACPVPTDLVGRPALASAHPPNGTGQSHLLVTARRATIRGRPRSPDRPGKRPAT